MRLKIRDIHLTCKIANENFLADRNEKDQYNEMIKYAKKAYFRKVPAKKR